jgi:hypothetical protein
MKTSGVSTVVHHFRSQFRLPGAASAWRPIAVKVANLAWTGKLRQFRQCFRKNGFMPLPIVGRAESAPDRMIDKNRSRRRDFPHDVECRANDQGGNAATFDDVSDKTDGLVAKGSIGNEEREVDFGLLQFLGKSGREIILDVAVSPYAAHEREMKGRKCADDSFVLKVCQCRAWKHDLRILFRDSANPGMVVDDDVAGCRIRSDPPVTEIFPRDEGLLEGEPQRRAAQQGNAGFAYRLLKRAPRRL